MDEKQDNRSRSTLRVLSGRRSVIPQIRHLAPAVRATAFWSAICLPWLALAFLFTGIATSYPMVFTMLVIVSFVATIIGHDYTRQ